MTILGALLAARSWRPHLLSTAATTDASVKRAEQKRLFAGARAMSHIWRDPGRTWFAILARRSHLRGRHRLSDCNTSSATRPVRHRTLACSSRPRRSVSAPGSSSPSCSRKSSWFACPNSPDLFMLAGLSELGQAYLSILNVYSLAYGLGGALLGIIVGCLPGLSATLCIALLTTLTIKMAANDAILILICSYVGTLYGGSRTAILLNIPAPPPMRHRAPMATRWRCARSRPGHRHWRHRAHSAARCSAYCVWRHLRRCLPKSRSHSGHTSSFGWRCSCSDIRQHCRQRSAQGMAHGHPGPVSWRKSARKGL